MNYKDFELAPRNAKLKKHTKRSKRKQMVRSTDQELKKTTLLKIIPITRNINILVKKWLTFALKFAILLTYATKT